MHNQTITQQLIKEKRDVYIYQLNDPASTPFFQQRQAQVENQATDGRGIVKSNRKGKADAKDNARSAANQCISDVRLIDRSDESARHNSVHKNRKNQIFAELFVK